MKSDTHQKNNQVQFYELKKPHFTRNKLSHKYYLKSYYILHDRLAQFEKKLPGGGGNCQGKKIQESSSINTFFRSAD